MFALFNQIENALVTVQVGLVFINYSYSVQCSTQYASFCSHRLIFILLPMYKKGNVSTFISKGNEQYICLMVFQKVVNNTFA